MTKIIYLSILVLSFMFNIITLDKLKGFERAIFIYNKLENFYDKNGYYPRNISILGNDFSKMNEYGSSCSFFDSQIDGIGDCYYHLWKEYAVFSVYTNFNTFEINLSKKNRNNFYDFCASC